MTEAGRRLAPEPIAAAAPDPQAVIAAHGSAEQRSLLDEVAAGERLLAFAHQPVAAAMPSWRPARHSSRGGWTLTGAKESGNRRGQRGHPVGHRGPARGGSRLFVVGRGRRAAQGYRTFDGQRGADVVLETPGPAARLGRGDARPSTPRCWASSRRCAPETVGAMDESCA